MNIDDHIPTKYISYKYYLASLFIYANKKDIKTFQIRISIIIIMLSMHIRSIVLYINLLLPNLWLILILIFSSYAHLLQLLY
jgi:hypothetical protein